MSLERWPRYCQGTPRNEWKSSLTLNSVQIREKITALKRRKYSDLSEVEKSILENT